MTIPAPLQAQLFVATGCAHCPTVLAELSEQLKKGQLATLTVTNIAVDNEKAAEMNIRSVPWFSLQTPQGLMIFPGQYSADEIRHWIKTAQADNGMVEYIDETLAQGQLMTLVQAIELQPDIFAVIIAMLRDEDTSMQTRIGLDALIEQFSGQAILRQHAADFMAIASEDNLRLQIDALHYLALGGDKNSREFLQQQSQSDNPQLRDAAIDALETLDELLQQ